MVVIQLSPCYPKGTTIEQQIEKLEEEWMEIVEADNWENLVSEYFDVAQVSVGIAGLNGIRKIVVNLNEIKEMIQEQNNGWANLYERFCTLHDVVMITGCSKRAIELAKMALCCCYDMICECEEDESKRVKLLEEFLLKHNEKLESRIKEWTS